MNKPKPSFVGDIENIPETINIYQAGEGDNLRFNKVQFVSFETTWLIRLSITKAYQPFCFILLYRDSYGRVNYTKDNIYSLQDKKQEDQIIKFINDWINNYIKEKCELVPEKVSLETEIKEEKEIINL